VLGARDALARLEDARVRGGRGVVARHVGHDVSASSCRGSFSKHSMQHVWPLRHVVCGSRVGEPV